MYINNGILSKYSKTILRNYLTFLLPGGKKNFLQVARMRGLFRFFGIRKIFDSVFSNLSHK